MQIDLVLEKLIRILNPDLQAVGTERGREGGRNGGREGGREEGATGRREKAKELSLVIIPLLCFISETNNYY